MPGMGELVIILLIVLVVFGANKLPSIGDALGRSIKNFKRASAVDESADGKDAKEVDAKAAKQVAAGKSSKLLPNGDEDDDEADKDKGEWEEVVVRRRKKASSSES